MKPRYPLLACALLAAASLAQAQANTSPIVSAKDTAEFQACLQRLQPMASAKGVKSATFERLTQGLAPDMSVLDKLDFQPEFRTPIWDYLSGLVDEERVADGKAMLVRHAETLKKVEQRYGVDPATVVAVWGVESNFGQTLGKYPLVQSLGTLSCFGRRQSFFRGELFATMRIVQKGDVANERLLGSWAGAFGHTQFMPSTFERLAVDFDGDGRADLMDNAIDALASTANFLKQAGWRTSQPWGMEVKLPSGFNTTHEGRRSKRPISEWASRGVKQINGSALPSNAGGAGLLTLAGQTGPAFLVFRNFDAIYSYNAAESYGLAIAHLSDRLRGAGPFATAWPTDDPGISRAERRELQALLILKGHEIGAVDGMLGEKSRAAIRIEQQRLGQEANGRGGMKILKALKGG
ncbi:MAG: lytic murein transglycosylase [Hydrogenophaga sp.]